MYCTVTFVKFNTCLGSNLFDVSKEHNLNHPVSEDLLLCAPIIQKENCKLVCEYDSIICATCVSSGKHEQQKKFDNWKQIDNKKVAFQKRSTKELEIGRKRGRKKNYIYMKPLQKAAFESNSSN